MRMVYIVIYYSAALCPDPDDIDNGMVTFTGSSIGDTATYSCDLDFVLIGGATTTCTLVDANSAAFQPAPPSCGCEYINSFSRTKAVIYYNYPYFY